jgi:hypothetical protein
MGRGIHRKDIAMAVDGDGPRRTEPGAERVDGGQAAGCQDLLHRAVGGIRDEDIAVAIDRDAAGRGEPAAERDDCLGLDRARDDAPGGQEDRQDETTRNFHEMTPKVSNYSEH